MRRILPPAALPTADWVHFSSRSKGRPILLRQRFSYYRWLYSSRESFLESGVAPRTKSSAPAPHNFGARWFFSAKLRQDGPRHDCLARDGAAAAHQGVQGAVLRSAVACVRLLRRCGLCLRLELVVWLTL